MKGWPAERYVELARALLRVPGRRLVLAGHGEDCAVAARIAAAAPISPEWESEPCCRQQCAASLRGKHFMQTVHNTQRVAA